MTERSQHAARVALSLAGVDAAAQARVLAELPQRLDRAAALARRDASIRGAHTLVGSPRILAGALREFHARAWPHLRHLAQPPDDAPPLRRALFLACQGCEDAGADMPAERQVRRIIL